MSKRNLILLIITLSIIVIAVFGYLYSRKSSPTNSGEGTNFGFDFNPFNNNNNPPKQNPPTNISGYPTPSNENIPAGEQKLKKISSMPIAGYGPFLEERYKDIPEAAPSTTTPPAKTGTKKPTAPATEFVSALRYVAKETGNIYETFADNIGEKKFTSTLIPQVYEAYFGNNGGNVIMRYLKSNDETIETFMGILPKEVLGADSTTGSEVKGTFLPEGVTDLSLPPGNSKVFYLFNNNNNAVGTTSDLEGGKKTQVFTSPFTEWLSQWPKDSLITITTKPSSLVPGYLYSIDPVKKTFQKILGEIGGLTTLVSPDGKLVLYGNGTVSLNLYKIESRETQVLGLRTLPEKCVWGKVSDALYCAIPKFIPAAAYPDKWYQGDVSFNDQIWKIDTKTGNTTLLLDPVTVSGEEVDGIKLMLDNNENYLFFVNKKDSYLWEFNLK